jgi:hypothetical protein
MKLLVYVPLLTPRIKYIFNFIFNDVLKTQVGFSSNLAEFKQSELPKISYADHPVADELFFKNSDLLLAHNIVQPNIKTTSFGDTIVPFAVSGSTLPFDVFAASFYFVSRYEEYLPFNQNKAGFFSAAQSLQHKLKLLQIPIVDAWALILKNILLKKYPKLLFFNKQFSFNPVVCMVSSRKPNSNKISRLASKAFEKIRMRFPTTGFNRDKQAEIKTFVEQLQEPYGTSAKFYYNNPKDTLNECEGELRLPESCLRSINTGIQNDFRMGYTKTPGFRAGTCTPFHWYDLQLEKNTHLLLHPVAINDLSLKIDNKLNTDEVLGHWKPLFDAAHLFRGSFCLLWHQDNLVTGEAGKAGRKLYKEMLANYLPLVHDLRPQ